jgi:hypothetical protein
MVNRKTAIVDITDITYFTVNGLFFFIFSPEGRLWKIGVGAPNLGCHFVNSGLYQYPPAGSRKEQRLRVKRMPAP